MKGLLHRLAARAAGTATALRSDARMPYGADVVWADVPEPGRAPEALDALSPIASQGADGARQAASRRTETPVRATSLFEVPEANPEQRRELAASSVRDKTEGGEPGGSSSMPRAVDDESVAGIPTPIAEHLSFDATETSAHDAVSRAPAAQRSPRPVRDGLTQPAAQRARSDPLPLMPQAGSAHQSFQPNPTATSSRRPAWPQTGSAASVAEETTEVHIHIGRIDVSAVPEPAPPRRRPATGPAPMSLEGYLARRGRA